MSLPGSDLPFFAYGIFRPGQLGFLRLREFVRRIEPDCAIGGTLRERDGLPIIDEEGRDIVKGSLLVFDKQKARNAYLSIAKIEPAKHYRWGVGRVRIGKDIKEANVLFGKSPKKGSNRLEEPSWDGKKDPLFTSALGVVEEILEQNKRFEADLKPLFRLQMAYLLLWSAIERYVSLRYHLGNKVNEKVNQMANEEAFAVGLQKWVSGTREVYRADEPGEKASLDPSNPKKSLDYYYRSALLMA